MPQTEAQQARFDWREAGAAIDPAPGAARPGLSLVFTGLNPATVLIDAGTIAPNPWTMLPQMAMEPAATFYSACMIPQSVPGWGANRGLDDGIRLLVPLVSRSVTPSGGQLARELKLRSGLTDNDLSALFPVTRETFNRWQQGGLPVGRESLERLRSLHTLVTEIDRRVDSVKEWLHSQNSDGTTAYELLMTKQLTRVWDLITRTQPAAESGRNSPPAALAFDHRLDDYEPDVSDWIDD
jgi:transcriptional regulator with XRE-family HTH domain